MPFSMISFQLDSQTSGAASVPAVVNAAMS